MEMLQEVWKQHLMPLASQSPKSPGSSEQCYFEQSKVTGVITQAKAVNLQL